MGAQLIVISSSAIIMMAMINAYGAETAAAYGVAVQIWTYVQMPAMAIGASVSSMAAQSVGAKKWDRVERSAHSGVLINVLLTGSLVVLLYLADPFITDLFLPGPLIILLISLFAARIAFAKLLEPSWGQDAIWWSFPISMALSTALALAYYRWGGWRKARMGPPAREVEDAPSTGAGVPAVDAEVANEDAPELGDAVPAKAL
jgi:Na+-driven multidrug efflux pump